MPGFNIQGHGSGASASFEPKFKFRWKFKFMGMENEILAEKARRPTIKWNEKPLKKGHMTSYFAADVVWEPITITFYDIEDNPANATLELYKYNVNFGPTPSNHEWSFVGDRKARPGFYKATAQLEMLDAHGDAIEIWRLHGAWVHSINFGELTYTASDIQKVDVIIRFDLATTRIEGKNKEL